MKKRIVALLLCVQMILVNLPPVSSVNTDWAGEGASQDGTESNITVESVFPESNLFWMSIRDYLLDQVRKAWNHPGNYVGYEVTFVSYWDSIICRPDVKGNEQSVYVSLEYGSENQNNTMDPEQTKLVIEDYYIEEQTQYLWYKVKAADGYTLPDVLAENPYVMHLNGAILDYGGIDYEPPTFVIGSPKAIFRNASGTVSFKKDAVAASKSTAVDISELPGLFDVQFVHHQENYGNIVWDHADLGDIAAAYTTYRYVAQEDIVLISAEASAAYEQMMNAEDTYEYYEVMGKIPDSVLAQLSDKHKAQMDAFIQMLEDQEKVSYETTVDIQGIQLPLSVVGRLPENHSVQASLVSTDTVISEGFDVKSADAIVAALDIKLVSDLDGTQWQPKEGRRVRVSIGLGALGYADGTVLELQHKHGEKIENFDIAVVDDGALTVHTSGFSIYLVQNTDQTGNLGTAVNANNPIEIAVGDPEQIYYFRRYANRDDWEPSVGTWAVTDLTGAIHYTVHSKSDIGHGGMLVPYIKINALKEATGIKLVFSYRDGNNTVSEEYTLNVVTPKASTGGKKLYLKDDVNASGRIIATLVDDQGNEIVDGLAGAAFKWERDDGYYINPKAYGDGYSSMNIVVDHAGLVEARMKDDGSGYEPTTYHVDVTLADGNKVDADYTVYYQSEIINSDFEFPDALESNYTYFPNGWQELYWKTTAPGSGDKLTMDIEYADMTNNRNDGTDFGTGGGAASGVQFAELNAEAFGALYQDIISVPGEDINWWFAHAPRRDQSWAKNISNAMFIVIGATENAQQLNHQDLEKLGAQAKSAANGDADFLTGKKPQAVTYNGAEYSVWYHDAKTYEQNTPNTLKWEKLTGEYTVPDGQYRTRLFFVSEKRSDSTNINAGNLIDTAQGGTYKKYLIEYYLGKVDTNNQLTVEYHQGKDETGQALIYSSVPLANLDALVSERKQYLHKILINGENCPYNIRYAGDASLYIEKYPWADGFKAPADSPNNYDDYDIVMQVYLRDVVISVQKELVFPGALTPEQKLAIIEECNKKGGYQADFKTTSVNSGSYSYLDEGSAFITQRDPKGNYTGYYPVEEYPTIGYTYRVEEEAVTELPGLRLVQKEFTTWIYTDGKKGDPQGSQDYTQFDMVGKANFAEILVRNIYEEKEITITYQAIGNGKLAYADNGEYLDNPTETIKFYSQSAKGAMPLYDPNDASFVGWFKDEACQNPVTAADGVWDKNTNSFKPNAHVINTESITFYAKFESGTIVINRTNASPGQTFVYYIQVEGPGHEDMDIYVTLECDENGDGSVTVHEVPLNQAIKVTECEDWTWRHIGGTQNGSNSETVKKLVFDFDGKVTDTKWLNGYSPPEENVFKGGG